MASGAVWGIDIGQCALKALKCRAHEDPNKVIAEAFDYIEYPKILSQPGSDPNELIADALKQFLSRNSVIGDRIAVSVSGQAGLARFIKLPPVETKKIPDIVRYEARQQIPFDLNDVVWDYQRMGGGSVEEGFALETEIGLFAMKREAVFRALNPFLKLGIEVDIVQLTPEVLYNYLRFDQLTHLPPPDEYDPENPPDSVVIVSLGTDATDLVITNGYRLWQRSIPLGGSHFTKALTRELKLTFAKAEHLKRNATTASDPKAVFQAMKPVFDDLLTELQRSIGYFSNLYRSDKIGRVVALGNAMKLPGLRRYLSQKLGYEIERIESYRGLVGAQVLSAPTFQENLLSFGVSYGLTLQGIGKEGVYTNLLPKEIVQDRLIKRKKPWAVAAAAVLLLGVSIHYAASSLAFGTVDPNRADWKQAHQEAASVIKEAGDFKRDSDTAVTEFNTTNETGKHLVGNVEGRILWLELLRAINACLPSDPPPKPDEKPKPISDRNELHITNIDCQPMEDVSSWWAGVKPKEGGAAEGAAASDPAAGDALGTGAPAGDAAGGPSGPGVIVRIKGHHFHNEDRVNQAAKYVEDTLLKNLREKTGKLPVGENGALVDVKMSDLGISHPVLVNPLAIKPVTVTDPNVDTDASHSGAMGRQPAATDEEAKEVRLNQFDFDVQFCWKQKKPSERLKENKEKLEKEQSKDPTREPTRGNPKTS
jgi:type IV pilus assembly protein PilM